MRLAGDYPDAEAALKEIPSRRPDVVLMDINLPGLNGVECVRQLKSSLPAIQFLMLTVYEDNDSLFHSLKAGASGYLKISIDTVRSYVRTVYEKLHVHSRTEAVVKYLRGLMHRLSSL